MKSNGALGSTWYGTVAPLVGAWIEMVKGGGIWAVVAVAPLVGAWIEIISAPTAFEESVVAPLVGAWIEIIGLYSAVNPCHSRSPRGSVD